MLVQILSFIYPAFFKCAFAIWCKRSLWPWPLFGPDLCGCVRGDRWAVCDLQVNEAEEERLRSEREHQRVTQLCQEAEARVQTLQKALKRVIVKSKPYFELKAQFNHILEVRNHDGEESTCVASETVSVTRISRTSVGKCSTNRIKVNLCSSSERSNVGPTMRVEALGAGARVGGAVGRTDLPPPLNHHEEERKALNK